MSDPADRLSPRQRECLRLVWERQATSKEIARELGISKTTVDGYIREAVELLGATDRRDAAHIVFRGIPRAGWGDDPAGVTGSHDGGSVLIPSSTNATSSRPWRPADGARNTMTLAQTLGWIAVIALGSLVALALASSIGSGMPSVWLPALRALRGLTL